MCFGCDDDCRITTAERGTYEAAQAVNQKDVIPIKLNNMGVLIVVVPIGEGRERGGIRPGEGINAHLTLFSYENLLTWGRLCQDRFARKELNYANRAAFTQLCRKVTISSGIFASTCIAIFAVD